MGLYNVVEPCVVGKLHYARPTAQPIEVDDVEAGPLVEAGSLEPYPRLSRIERQEAVVIAELERESSEAAAADATREAGQKAGEDFVRALSAEPESPAPRPRARRRTED